MKELSIFIDKSGDFGEFDYRSPYYIITMLFHNQDENLQPAIAKLNTELSFIICVSIPAPSSEKKRYIQTCQFRKGVIFSIK